MKTRRYPFLLCLALPVLLILLAACGSTDTSSGNAGSSTPTTPPTNTPTSAATPSPTSSPVPPGLGNNYAFVRANQVWVALNGAAPVQATNFSYSSAGPQPNVFLSQPLWFDQDRYVAFTFKVLLAGLGGGGCGFTSDYGRMGALYILDTSTMKLTQVTVPGDPATHSGTPYDGYFEFLFQEDTTHLLAWHGSGIGLGGGRLQQPGERDGLYRYDVASGSLTLTLPASKVPNADASESWAPMRYHDGQLYYEAQAGNGNTSNYTIYKHSITNVNEDSVKVLDAGSEPFCTQNSDGTMTTGPFTGPGFDVSPDGKYLAAQTLTGSDPTKPAGQVTLLTLGGGSTTTIFQKVPSQYLNNDVTLTWSPDSKTLALSEIVYDTQSGASLLKLYTTTVADTADIQEYSTSAVGNYYPHLALVLWHSSSTGFALYTYQQFNSTTQTNTYLYTVGQPHPQVLLKDARNFAWG